MRSVFLAIMLSLLGACASQMDTDAPDCTDQKCDDLASTRFKCALTGALEPNDRQESAPVVDDIIEASFETGSDVDWYVIEVEDSALSNVVPAVRANAGSDEVTFQVCAYYYTDAGENLTPDECGNADAMEDEFGVGCCTRPTSQVATLRMDATRSLKNDSGAMYIRASALSDVDACSDYTLVVTH